MASITERAQRMEKDLRETNAKHDRSAAELQVRWENWHTCGVCVCGFCACAVRNTRASSVRAESAKKNEWFNVRVSNVWMRVCFNPLKLSLSRSMTAECLCATVEIFCMLGIVLVYVLRLIRQRQWNFKRLFFFLCVYFSGNERATWSLANWKQTSPRHSAKWAVYGESELGSCSRPEQVLLQCCPVQGG